MANNDKIKSVYDPKVMESKRQDSATKLLERLTKEKDLVYVDKSRTFYGVKNSDKKNIGYYAIQKNQKDDSLMCNCFDYAHYIEINPKHKCKHILFVESLIKNKVVLPVKDLSGLVE